MAEEFLRRYTDLPYLLQILKEKQLTLLSPSTWEDKNDSRFIEKYRTKKSRVKSVLALCMTDCSATFHHWKVFAPGSSGVCIKFRKAEFVAWAKELKLDAKPVVYRSISKVKANPPTKEELPYFKRHAFRDEREFRVVYKSKDDVNYKQFPLEISLIAEIVVNPWLHPSAFPAVKHAIRCLVPSPNVIQVRQTTLLNSPEWDNVA